MSWRAYATDPERPNELLAWLEPLLSDRPDILPEPRGVAQAFGRDSLTFGQARHGAGRVCGRRCGDDPEVRLKRDLWDRAAARSLRRGRGRRFVCSCSIPT